MKIYQYIMFVICGVLITGCGYHFGSIAHPQLESVAIAEAQNESVEPNLSYFIRQHLAEEVQFDGSFKLLTKREADCIIYPRIVSTRIGSVTASSTNNDITFVARTYSASVRVEYTVLIPGRPNPISQGVVEGQALYQILWDPEVHKQEAFNAACKEAARKIVTQLAEGW